MYRAFSLALGQMSDPAFRRVAIRGVGVSLAALLMLIALAQVGLVRSTLFETGWLEFIVDVLGGLSAVVVAWLLFPLLIPLLVSLFLEDVVVAVERRHYPRLTQPPHMSLLAAAWAGVWIAIVGLIVNLVALPVYILTWFVGFGALLYYLINGYLLGREYFEMVALRRVRASEVARLRKRWRWPLFLTGAVIAFLLTVPLVNLFAPIVAAAAMVHLFEDIRARESHP